MSVVKSTSISLGQVGHDAVFMRKACQWYWQTLTKSNNIQTSFGWTLGFQNFLGCRGCYAYSQWYQALFSCPLSAPTVAGGIVSSLGSQRRAKPWKHIRETCGVRRRHSKAEKITWSNQQRQSIYSYSSQRMSKIQEIHRNSKHWSTAYNLPPPPVPASAVATSQPHGNQVQNRYKKVYGTILPDPSGFPSRCILWKLLLYRFKSPY